MKKYFFALLILTVVLFSQENEKVKLSGQIFFDYYNNIQNSIDTLRGMHGFRFRRVNFTADFTITEKMYSRFRLESDGYSFSSQEKKLAAYLKDVSLNYKFDKQTVSVGLIPTSYIDMEETYWNYRCIEKIMMDLKGIGATRDFGISVKGSLDNNSTANYWIMFGNNSNLGPETDKYKRFYSHFAFKPISILEFSGDFVFTNSESNKNVLTGKLGIFLKEKGTFTLGFSGLINSRQKVTTDDKAINTIGFSAFGNVNLMDKLKVLGRIDYYDPNIDSKVKNDSDIMVIFGVDYNFEKNLNIIPNIIYKKYELSGKKADITANITFFWSF